MCYIQVTLGKNRRFLTKHGPAVLLVPFIFINIKERTMFYLFLFTNVNEMLNFKIQKKSENRIELEGSY